MSGDKKRISGILAVAFFTLLTYSILYLARNLDDNRLSSWQWCFQPGVFWDVFIAISAGCILSHFLSKVTLLGKNAAPFLFVMSSASASLFWSEPEAIADASRYFTQAKYLELYGVRYFFDQWGKVIPAWTDMPLVPFFYGLVFRIFGEVRVYTQIFNTMLFSLSAVITYLIGKHLWDEEVGFYGGALLLGMPYLYSQVPLMLVDIPTMFFFLLAVLMFMKALDKGGTMVVVSAFAIFLAFFSKYSTWLMLSVLPVIVVVNFTQERLKGAETGKTTALLLKTSYIIGLSALFIGLAVSKELSVISDQVKILMAYQKPGLNRWGESFISIFFFQIHPLISAAALYSIYSAVGKKDLKYMVVAWLIALVFLLEIRRTRYIIMVLPMLSLAAAYGMSRMENAYLKKFLLGCIITSSLAVALFAYLPFMQKMSAVNLKEAGRFLDTLPERNAEVFALVPAEPVVDPWVSVPLLDLFTQKRIIYNNVAMLSEGARERIQNSSLRFTLELRVPSYYNGGSHTSEDNVLVVVSESAKDPIPSEIRQRMAGYSQIAVFDKYDGIFQYRTSVRVFRRIAGDAMPGSRANQIGG